MKKQKYIILSFVLLLGITVSGQEKFRSGIFLHHSTGRNIWGPNGSSTSVPDELVKYNEKNGYSGKDTCILNETAWPLDPWVNEWEAGTGFFIMKILMQIYGLFCRLIKLL